jgi:hypothetical protein
MFHTEVLDKIKTHILCSCVTFITSIFMEHDYQLRLHQKIIQGLELTTDPNTIIVLTLEMVLTWVPLYVKMYHIST